MRLTVARPVLPESLEMPAQAAGSRVRRARLCFDYGWLHLGAGNTDPNLPAEDTWPAPVSMGLSWIRRIARKPTARDPISIRFQNGRLYGGPYSEPAALSRNGKPNGGRQEAILPELPDGSAGDYESREPIEAQLEQAAEILAPLLISPRNI
jgi:hypothetical protein